MPELENGHASNSPWGPVKVAPGAELADSPTAAGAAAAASDGRGIGDAQNDDVTSLAMTPEQVRKTPSKISPHHGSVIGLGLGPGTYIHTVAHTHTDRHWKMERLSKIFLAAFPLRHAGLCDSPRGALRA